VFRTQIETLLADGWRVVPLADIIPLICCRERDAPEEPALAITFDDAYVDVLRAAPWLASRSLPATVFVLTDFIGQTNFWNPKAETITRHLSRAEMLDLAVAGVDFQFHGCDHHRLTKFSREQLDQLFSRGQAAFASVFSRNASIIAYPYGAFNEAVLETAARFFRHGLSVSQGQWAGPECEYRLNRVEVTNGMTPGFLLKLLSIDRRKRRGLIQEQRLRETRPGA
jgi:peptidoglycan/xylan/chitin deacetylase (PgdA/CDA1 family)